MSEHEPRSLPWYEDETGHYIRIRTESGAYDLRPEDTDIYLHDEPYGQIDHLFGVKLLIVRRNQHLVGQDIIHVLRAHGSWKPQ